MIILLFYIIIVAVSVVVNASIIVVIVIIINSIKFVTDIAATQSWLLQLIAFRGYQLIHSSRK